MLLLQLVNVVEAIGILLYVLKGLGAEKVPGCWVAAVTNEYRLADIGTLALRATFVEDLKEFVLRGDAHDLRAVFRLLLSELFQKLAQ